MNTLIFDLETNAISNFRTLLGLKEIHCVGIATPDGEPEIVPIEDALERLRLADVIVGHNIQDFDVRVIKRLYPDWDCSDTCIRDTLIMSRMLWPDVSSEDWLIADFPRKLVGKQSLKAWGARLGMDKGDFGETTDWAVCTPEMEEYCLQDVRVTQRLWKRIQEADPPENPTILEHEFAAIISQQERNGFGFDVDAAEGLHSTLLGEKAALSKQLSGRFEPQVTIMKMPKYWEDPITEERYRVKKDAPASVRPILIRGEPRTKVVPFNPSSRDQIANGLISKYGWVPTEYTPTGRPKIDESTLSVLDYPEASLLVRFLTLMKRLGQIADGKESWLKVVDGGRIYGRVNPCGAVTSRCTHFQPNIAQVPSVTAPYGVECRSLFIATEGYVLVGVDASGLELRCLAHYTYPYDGGRYCKEILGGDIHTANQKAAGLESRDIAKNFIYALCYGAGDAKIGSLIGGGSREGHMMKSRFFSKMPALKKIKDGVSLKVDRDNYLRAIDKRILHIRSSHSALNTLLQSAGAIAMKVATCRLHRAIRARGWSLDDVMQVAHVHDEIQLQVREDIAEDVGRISVQSIRDAGKVLGFRCPLDGEYRIGRNWAETH